MHAALDAAASGQMTSPEFLQVIILALVTGSLPSVLAFFLGRRDKRKQLDAEVAKVRHDAVRVDIEGSNAEVNEFDVLTKAQGALLSRYEQANLAAESRAEKAEQRRDQARAWGDRLFDKLMAMHGLVHRLLQRTNSSLQSDELDIINAAAPERLEYHDQ